MDQYAEVSNIIYLSLLNFKLIYTIWPTQLRSLTNYIRDERGK